jgi:hypothetical protein
LVATLELQLTAPDGIVKVLFNPETTIRFDLNSAEHELLLM